MPTKELQQVYFKNQKEFRDWLTLNYNKSDGIWLIYFKKHTQKESIHYAQALEEALCFGWIDSTVKRIDEEQYMQIFSPRTNLKNWSDVNKLKVIELIKNKKMTNAGLMKIDEYAKTGKLSWKTSEIKSKMKEKSSKQLHAPISMLAEFAKNEPALSNFNQLAPSYKREYINWIASAKRKETQEKRLKESIGLLKENKKLGMK
ncbi:YdeI/OmpD-associated family protein [Sunxiuqinia sp. A32]|uniref:YdeI/OmpD-associated family protein n=1 Tax=Sunxiuqinia sp. A32 TaxID=3461496 RepID=UPI0040453999